MFDHATYLTLLFAWLAPVLAIQWHAGARILRARWRAVAVGTLLPTAYLAAADHYALRAGIWQIGAERATGIVLAGLPLEELLFFLLTNLVVVQAVILFLAPELTPAFARAQLARHLRGLRAALAPAHWRASALATAATALAATVAAALAGSAPAFHAPAALLVQLAPQLAAPWPAVLPWPWLPSPALLSGTALYLVLGTLAGWVARGDCLIARTLVVLTGLASHWWYADATSSLAAILALGPLLPGLLRQTFGKRAGSRLPNLANEHSPC